MTKEQLENLKALGRAYQEMVNGSKPWDSTTYNSYVNNLIVHSDWLLDCAQIEG
jgi:hypothetical protein